MIEIYTSDGARRVATTSSGADGRFSIVLEPGDYLLVPLPPNPGSPLPAAGKQAVTVRPDRWQQVAISYNTGIR